MTEEEIKEEQSIREREAVFLKKAWAEVPEIIRNKIVVKKKKNDAVIKVLKKAILDPNIDEGKKEKYRILLADPKVNEETVETNEKIAEIANRAYERNLRKYIKRGNIRPKNHESIIKYENHLKETFERENRSSNEAES